MPFARGTAASAVPNPPTAGLPTGLGTPMGVPAQNFQDRLARTGDFAQLPAQTTRQRG